MKEKLFWTLNFILLLSAVVLVLHLGSVELPALGKAAYLWERSEPVCLVEFKGEQSLLKDKELCCRGLEEQLRCEKEKKKMIKEGKELSVDKKCYTGEGAVEYWVNNKMYNYCFIAGDRND